MNLLPESERQLIFTRYIWPRFIAALIRRESPEAILLGGQPGAGKSNFIASREYIKSGYSIVNGDG